LTAEQVADGIVARESKEPRFPNGKPAISKSVLDPSAFNVVSGPSIAERMSTRGIYFSKADNARTSERGALSGWDAVRQRLIGINDIPLLYFFSTICSAPSQWRNTIQTVLRTS
jgi:hypothetical protein